MREPIPASPGTQDALTAGVFSSGAGQISHPQPMVRLKPWDWGGQNPTLDKDNNALVAGFVATIAKTARALRTRPRGVSPWSGFFHNRITAKPGGTTDMNTGAGSVIAGGKGSASSMVRLHGGRTDRNMRLPVNPGMVTRGGLRPLPSGGDGYGNMAVPAVNAIPGGGASVINIIQVTDGGE